MDFADGIKDLEVGRFSWIIQVGPMESKRSIKSREPSQLLSKEDQNEQDLKMEGTSQENRWSLEPERQ